MKTDIWPLRGPRVSGFTFFPADQQKNKEHSDVRFNQVSPLIMASQDLPVRFDSLAKKGISFISYPVKWMGKADQPMQANKKSLRLLFIHSSFKSYKTWRV